MSSEEPRAQLYEMTPPKKKYQSNGRGIGIWFSLWGLILFGFAWHVGLEGWPMWAWSAYLLGQWALL